MVTNNDRYLEEMKLYARRLLIGGGRLVMAQKETRR
jgi:hypothetical protein